MLGKSSTLFQLSKTDRNIVGRQLQALLTNDFASSQGKKAAQKNAFALLRLQRYKVRSLFVYVYGLCCSYHDFLARGGDFLVC